MLLPKTLYKPIYCLKYLCLLTCFNHGLSNAGIESVNQIQYQWVTNHGFFIHQD